MEHGSGPDSVHPSDSYDKSRVLNVKPLRCLAPMFPSPSGFTSFPNPQAPPFICAPPFGPFPLGFSPFYPFCVNPEAQRTPQQQTQNQNEATHQAMPPPLPTQFTDTPNGHAGPSKKSYKTRKAVDSQSQSQSANKGKGDSARTASEEEGFTMNSVDVEATSNEGKLVKSSKSHKKKRSSQEEAGSADGDRESVESILMAYDSLRRRIIQTEEAKDAATVLTKRADLKAGTIMMNHGLRTNTKKRIGAVPGVEVGDIFYFRMEMCLVGLHGPIMAGIDYTSVKYDQEEEPVALSIVSSGEYEDDGEDSDVLIYSGQGGNIYRKDREVVDQKLERGNLALERSLRRANEVRVIRGIRDLSNPNGKVYVYDGLYKIQESWMEKGKSGCSVFKYKLVRLPGQPDAFATWKSIQQARANGGYRLGVILPDLTSGAENLPVSLVNDVDKERGPAYFTYFPTLKYSKPVKSVKPSLGCNCNGGCIPGNPDCSCVQKNGGDLPYTSTGILVTRQPLIHECGPSCGCYPDCRNRVSQTGLKVHLEVFKTKDKGWGLRSRDPLRAGTFICEYAGEVIKTIKLEESRDEDEDYEYIFDVTEAYDNSLQWNYSPELLGEERAIDLNEAYKLPIPLTITAKKVGNVARFMNHSCSPTVFWQPVLHEHHGESHLHIAFCAIKHIPPMMELAYDYEKTRSNYTHCRRTRCLCGSSKCRGYFG